MSVVIHRPGEGERYGIGPSSVTIKATGEDTGGSFYLGESTIEPGFPGPPPHRHRELHDMFYVLEGTLTLHVDGTDHEAPAGTFACIPPGTVHTFANRSDAPVRFLNFNTPAGWEEYMRDLGKAYGRQGAPPTREQIGEIASRYDFEVG